MRLAQVITQDTYHHIEALGDLVPLHKRAALGVVDACLEQLPAAVSIASTPPSQGTFICTLWTRTFVHSTHFITRSVSQFLGEECGGGGLNIIALHLGSGASACAIRHGRSWDTSMGPHASRRAGCLALREVMALTQGL